MDNYAFTSPIAFKNITWAIKNSLPCKVKISEIRLAVAKSEGFHSIEAYLSELETHTSKQPLDSPPKTPHPMQKAIDAIPDLVDHGIGLFNNGRDIPIAERANAFEADRKELLNRVEVFGLLTDWLMQFEKRKTINTSINSYSLKHQAEKAIGQYVSNGVLIAAAICAGFDFKRSSSTSPNACFNISKPSLVRLAEKQKNNPHKTKPTKADNFRKLITAGINAALEHGKFSLQNQEDAEGEMMQDLLGRQSLIRWRSIGHGEISFTVWWGLKPKCKISSTTLPLNKTISDGLDAACSCWIERKDGAWIQGKGAEGVYDEYMSRDAMRVLSEMPPVEPKGFKTSGSFYP